MSVHLLSLQLTIFYDALLLICAAVSVTCKVEIVLFLATNIRFAVRNKSILLLKYCCFSSESN